MKMTDVNTGLKVVTSKEWKDAGVAVMRAKIALAEATQWVDDLRAARKLAKEAKSAPGATTLPDPAKASQAAVSVAGTAIPDLGPSPKK